MNAERLMSLLGLAQKAHKIVSGEVAVEQAIRANKARLLLIAADASENTKKSYQSLATYYQVACHETLSKDQFGIATGKPPRAALAVTDNGFSHAIVTLLS
jgi:ribosomal protein L7Ae-like RNA K-turn-binding protein